MSPVLHAGWANSSSRARAGLPVYVSSGHAGMSALELGQGFLFMPPALLPLHLSAV